MTDDRTREQIKADDNLSDAISECIAAYGLQPGDVSVITDYVVLIKTEYWNDDREEDERGQHAVISITKEDDDDMVNALGLVDYVATQWRARITRR